MIVVIVILVVLAVPFLVGAFIAEGHAEPPSRESESRNPNVSRVPRDDVA